MMMRNIKMLNSRLPNTKNRVAGPATSAGRHTPQISPKRHQFVTSLLLANCAALFLLLLLPAPLQCQSSYQMHHEPVASNEINLHGHQHQPDVNKSSHKHRSREVKNLHLIPELRSIRLRWDYEREELKVGKENDWPASFRIRYCELTSWQAEIKCRQKDMQVQQQQRVNDAHSPEVSPAASPSDEVKLIAVSGSAARVASQQLALQHQDNSTVIQLLGQQGRELRHPAKDEPSSRTYEAQIFDLRALTSYTFNVQVLRFLGDDGGDDSRGDSQLLPASTSRSASGGRPARRLDLATPTGLMKTNNNELIPATHMDSADEQPRQANLRVETKPFSAEALKCLANSSEVLVNTGRYFGGRISVEGAPNGPATAAACQLLGNRSSPQSAYLFRIDHELCRSKVLDSQRIETMILVHENKDLLTHNTARFLIQCNISQRTFTVRASVSLPKVNGLTSAAATSDANGTQKAVFRPATVTAVASQAQQASARGGNEELVRLGSMPGVFRSLQRANPPHLPLESESQLHSTTIVGENERAQAAIGGRRQSKELQQAMPQALVLPRPVDVSSGLLFVGRKHDIDEPTPSRAATREARLLTAKPNEQVERVSTAAMVVEQQQHQPIVMTNNHRVAGDFLPLAQAVANLERRAKSASGGGDSLFSIKYSPESVGEYPLARLVVAAHDNESPRATDTPTTTTTTSARSRSGRMRQIDQQPSTTAGRTTTTTTTTTATARPHINLHGTNRVESRMGESRQAANTRVGQLADSMSAAESSIDNRVSMSATSVGSANQTAPGTSGGDAPTATSPVVANPTLAQNITGALLRWSLKTLGNLARKSLDALANEAELAAPVSRVKSLAGGEMPQADANEDEDATQTSGRSTDSPQPAGAITKIHEGELDGFLVERRKTTKQPWASLTIAQQETKGQSATTASTQQQQVRAATQSADLRDSRRPHQLEAPPASPRQPPTTTSTTSTPVTSIRPSKRHKISPSDWHEKRSNGHPRFPATASDDASSLLPPSEDQSASPSSSLSQANATQTAPSSSSSLWPIYCLWSLVGLLGLITLTAFLLVSNRHRRAPTTSGSFHPSSHHQPTGRSSGGAGILAQINEAIHRHHHSAALSRAGNDPPPGLASQGEVYVQAKQQHVIQSPSVQRRNLTLGTSDGCATATPADTQRRQFASVAHVISPGGGSASSAASTRSTSAASTAHISSQLGGSDSAHIAFSDSSSSANSVSPDHLCLDNHRHRSQPPHESYCKNHEQFVYTDYLLLNDSDCLANDCRGESFA